MKKFFALFLLAFTASAWAAVCTPTTFNGAGSTLQGQTVPNAPGLEQALIAAYNAAFPAPVFAYNAGTFAQGSSAGINQVLARSILFGGTDVPPTNAQVSAGGLLTFPIAVAGDAIVFHLNGFTGTLNLTKQNLADIFGGNITVWGDAALVANNPGLAGNTTVISPVVRADGSGSTNDFTTFLASATPSVSPAWTLVGNGPFTLAQWVSYNGGDDTNFSGESGTNALLTQVNTINGAIGYASYGSVVNFGTPNNLQVAAVQNSNGQFVLPSTTSIGLAVSGITVPADLRISTINSPVVDAYPIASPTNIVVSACQPSTCIVQNLRNYLLFVATLGQSIAISQNFGPLSDTIISQYISNLSLIKALDPCFNASVSCCLVAATPTPAVQTVATVNCCRKKCRKRCRVL